MIYLLDTNHAYLLLSQPAFPKQKRMDFEFQLCTPVLGELWFMVHNSRRRDDNRLKLFTVMKSVEIINYDTRFVEEFGRVRKELKTAGKSASQVDIQLASVARVLQLPILTADRDFHFVSGVTTENWLA